VIFYAQFFRLRFYKIFLKLFESIVNFKGTVARDFDAYFFIPIHRPDLDDGPLRGINFGRCACAEKQAF